LEKKKLGKRIYKTAGTPRNIIQQPTKGVKVIDIDQQRKYLSAVGILLY
jgi:hypothetical protein